MGKRKPPVGDTFVLPLMPAYCTGESEERAEEEEEEEEAALLKRLEALLQRRRACRRG